MTTRMMATARITFMLIMNRVPLPWMDESARGSIVGRDGEVVMMVQVDHRSKNTLKLT
jgi:hypothetical protein